MDYEVGMGTHLLYVQPTLVEEVGLEVVSDPTTTVFKRVHKDFWLSNYRNNIVETGPWITIPSFPTLNPWFCSHLLRIYTLYIK